MVNNNRLGFIWSQLASNAYEQFVEEEDYSTFTRRTAAEGAEFYARGLLALRNDMLSGFETGQLVVTARFGPKIGTCLPRFLYKAWSAVFDDDGRLRDDADIGAVDCLNQLTKVFGKISGGHTPDSEARVLDNFVQLEKEISSTRINLNQSIGKSSVRGILMAAQTLIAQVLGAVNPRDIVPKHGSGVCSDGTPVWRRYELPTWVEKIHNYWNLDEYFTLGSAHIADKWWCTLNIPEGNPRAKVLLVPKDARGPRLISCEPKEHMWIQQGLMSAIVGRTEQHPLSRRSVHFTDQSHNRKAAQLGSYWWKDRGEPRNMATIDLKDASDRIRLDIVQYLFPCEWAEALTRARSDETVLPNGRVVVMKKHAPMGSATCFPVMALVIWAILRAASPPGTKFLVYGDDIAIPAAHAQRAMEALEAIGLRVNRSKSFCAGPFRESCGGEYFKGTDVTPVLLRSMPYGGLECRDAMISFSNNLFEKFRYHLNELTAAMEREWGEIPRLAYIPNCSSKFIDLPRGNVFTKSVELRTSVGPAAPLPGVLFDYVSDTRSLKTRWNKCLQRREIQYVVGRPVRESFPKHDWSQLFRALVNPSVTNSVWRTAKREDAEELLGFDEVNNLVSYKKRWIPL